MDKKRAWEELRRVMPALHWAGSFKVGNHLLTGFFLQTQQVWFRIEHRRVFREMVQDAHRAETEKKRRKGIRQAYRYAIAAGLCHEKMPQLSGKVFYRGPGAYYELWPANEKYQKKIKKALKKVKKAFSDPQRIAWMR